jgi:nitrogen fixation NifU-like protein
MSDLQDLYKDVLIDHSRHPYNCRPMDHPTHQAEGHNPLCGDRVTVFLKVTDGNIEDASFTGEGCAICTASASLMTRRMHGVEVHRAHALFELFHELLTSHDHDESKVADLGDPQALEGVAHYPMRVKCATLPWHTLASALKNDSVTTVTT